MSPLVVLGLTLAGGLGAACRYGLDSMWRGDKAWATFTINCIGSFALGVLVAAGVGSNLWLIIGTGFCGGFTTFSTAMLDVVKRMRADNNAGAMKLLIVQAIAAFACAWLGILVALLIVVATI